MEGTVKKFVKLSHKQFRALLKKFRRKKKRQQQAKERERLELLEQQKLESSPTYKERQEDLQRNIRLYEEFEERERIRQNKLWLLREEQAQEEFRKKQKRLEEEKIRLEEERKRILEEFEKQEFVISKASKDAESAKSLKEEKLQAALSDLAEKDDGPWHNPIAPESYNAGIERDACMFFSKTGCCRFGDRCSRGHLRPDVSQTILIRGMYNHFSLSQTASDDYDADIGLEYTAKECYQHFQNFYEDVLPEFKKFGKVTQFKVCNNYEPHLRGNVYVQFSSEKEALEAYKNFNGRFYAGKQITCEFTSISRWKAAICGLYGKKGCPKGENCNFLHVFKNPNYEFWHADRDLPPEFKSYPPHSSRHSERNERHSYHSSDHRYRSRHEPHSDRHDYRSDRHDSRSDRYEPRSERYESRYESRSERSESRHESRSERSEFRYESRRERHESSHYDDESTESDPDSAGDYEHNSKASDRHSSKHKKRERDSRSRSRSPSELSNGGKGLKKKKKHKKKAKKKRRKSSSEDEN